MANFFSGQDGFVWFTGVVEDRDDPEKQGRVRVRCVGYHSDDLEEIPTKDLPWSWVLSTVHTSMNGLGHTPPFLVEGTWVVGFWRDPPFYQEAIIFGTLPGVPIEGADSTKGYYDPRSEDSTQSEEKYKYKPDFGPYPIRTSDSDVNRLAKNDANNIHPEIEERDNSFTENVPIANGEKILGDSDATVDTASIHEDKIATNIDLTATQWKEPITTDESIRGADATGRNPETKEDRVAPYKRRNPEYPYNHVYETESGHIQEFDDTPFAERIYEKHRSGTFYEIDADGNKVTRVVGQNYEIIAGNEFVNVKGDVNLTIDSNCKTYIKGDWNIQVDGNKTEVVKKNVTETYGTENETHAHTISVTGKRAETVSNSVTETYSDTMTQNITGAVTETYSDTMTQNVTGNVTETYSGNQTTQVSGNVDIDGARIDLN